MHSGCFRLKADINSRRLKRDLGFLKTLDLCDPDRFRVAHDVIVGDHIAVRRDHEATAGADFNAIQIDASLDAEFLDFGVNAADDPDEDCSVGGRFRALRKRRDRSQKECRTEQDGLHDPRYRQTTASAYSRLFAPTINTKSHTIIIVTPIRLIDSPVGAFLKVPAKKEAARPLDCFECDGLTVREVCRLNAFRNSAKSKCHRVRNVGTRTNGASPNERSEARLSKVLRPKPSLCHQVIIR